MKNLQALACALVLGIAGLAACSSGTATPPSNGACVKPAAPELLYPVPMSSGVPDNVGILIYAAAAQTSGITLFNGVDSSVATTPTALPSPLPSPIASPSSGLTLFAVSLPTLSPMTLYDARYPLPAPCNPTTATFGYFVSE